MNIKPFDYLHLSSLGYKYKQSQKALIPMIKRRQLYATGSIPVTSIHEACSVKRGLNTYAKSIDPCQPRLYAHADMQPETFRCLGNICMSTCRLSDKMIPSVV